MVNKLAASAEGSHACLITASTVDAQHLTQSQQMELGRGLWSGKITMAMYTFPKRMLYY